LERRYSAGHMRIVTWNCQGGFRRKLDRLASLAPDVAVVCEAPFASPYVQSLVDEPVSWHAAGAHPETSLTVAGFRGGLASCVLASVELCNWGVAVATAGGPGVLGVWSVPAPGRRYGDEVLAVIQAHAERIAGGNVAVAGDFNIDAHGVGNGGGGVALFAAIVQSLSDLGLISAYHAWTDEAPGLESAMTHFHLRRADRGFHIDYCFIPASWRSAIRKVSIGAPDEWLPYSDHMPLLVDLAL
jgi:exodeoxyribonuclease III